MLSADRMPFGNKLSCERFAVRGLIEPVLKSENLGERRQRQGKLRRESEGAATDGFRLNQEARLASLAQHLCQVDQRQCVVRLDPQGCASASVASPVRPRARSVLARLMWACTNRGFNRMASR